MRASGGTGVGAAPATPGARACSVDSWGNTLLEGREVDELLPASEFHCGGETV